jgi:hypothetical protein
MTYNAKARTFYIKDSVFEATLHSIKQENGYCKYPAFTSHFVWYMQEQMNVS